MMINKSLVISLIKSLVESQEFTADEKLDSIIALSTSNILKLKKNKALWNFIFSSIIEAGYCLDCLYHKTEKLNIPCAFCKKKIKEDFKKSSRADFIKLC